MRWERHGHRSFDAVAEERMLGRLVAEIAREEQVLPPNGGG